MAAAAQLQQPASASSAALASGRALKRNNALTAVLCGGLPAALLAWLQPASLVVWLAGFFLGLVWANGFEYLYHRYLLHLPTSSFGRRHLEHHSTVGTPEEPAHINLGGSPIWVVWLFAVNGIPVALADLRFGWGAAPAALLAFALYFIVVEEMHWRIHRRQWLPPGLRAARAHHMAHHDRADARFNVFLPLFDWLFGTAPKPAPPAC